MVWRFACLATLAFVAEPFGARAADPPSLVLDSVQPAVDLAIGFDEPSGLTLAPDGRLLSVSDDTRAVFRLDPDTGRAEMVFETGRDGFEGISAGLEDGTLLVAREDPDQLFLFDATTGERLERVRLRDVAGYARVNAAFEEGDDNQGLEGIVADPAGGRVLVVKETGPRLLLAISADLGTLTDVWELDAGRGFVAPGIEDADLDVSGLAMDGARNALWVAGDECACVFLLDLTTMTAARVPLDTGTAGPGALEGLEGLALDPSGETLFAVTDNGDGSAFLRLRIVPPAP